MSLFSKLNIQDSGSQLFLNTGCFLDTVTGAYERGVDNNYYLNSGMAPMQAYCGAGGCYKSTSCDSLSIGVLKIYSDSQLIKLDTENNSFGKSRFSIMANNDKSIVDRIVVKKSSEISQEEHIELIKSIVDEKLKHSKDYTVETPFVDEFTGKAKKILIPTIVTIDSFTLYRSILETENEEKEAVSDSSRNMDDMTDGRLKRKILLQFSRLAPQANIYFNFVSQVGNNMSLNPRIPPKKQLQHLPQAIRLKGASDMFTYLTNNLFFFSSPTPVLSSDNKTAQYAESSATKDINEVNTTVVRCKSAGDGTNIKTLISQSKGILNNLSDYHYLTSKDYGNEFGLDKKGYNRFTKLVPDVSLHRNSIISELDKSYELSRAMEILTQLHWISNNWDTTNFPVEIPSSVDDFYNLVDKKSEKRTDILNSRGYWTYNKKEDRKYMGIVEILKLLQDKK